MIIRASVFAIILAACSPAAMAGTEPDHIDSFSFMTRDVSRESLREIAGRVAAKHEFAPVEMKRREPVPADDRVPIVEFRGRDGVFHLSRFLALPDCVIAEFRIRGSGAPRTAAAMREDLQQELTAALSDRVQLHDHPSCNAD